MNTVMMMMIKPGTVGTCRCHGDANVYDVTKSNDDELAQVAMCRSCAWSNVADVVS